MAAESPPLMSEHWCVESVSEDGIVEVRFPDGDRCTITVPREPVPKFRRIVDMNR